MQTQNLPILLGKLDTRVAPLYVEPGTLSICQDVLMSRSNEFIKRQGWTPMTRTTTTGSLSTGKKLAGLDAASFVQTNDAFYGYSSALSKWVPGLSLISPAVQVTGLGGGTPTFNAYYGSNLDRALTYSGGYVFHAWVQATNTAGTTLDLYYEVIDYVTGQKLVQATKLRTGAGNGVRGLKWAATTGGHVCLFYWDGAGGPTHTLYARRISTSTPTTISAETTIASDLFGSTTPATIQSTGTGSPVRAIYDVRAKTGQAKVVFAYTSWTGGNIRVRYGEIDSSSLAMGTNAYGAGAYGAWRSIGILDHDWSDNNTYVAMSSDGSSTLNGTVVKTLDATYAVTATDVIHATDYSYNIIGYYGSSTKTIFYDYTGGGATSDTVYLVKATYSGAASVSTLVRGLGIASHVFKQGSTYYFVASHDTRGQRSYYLYDQSGQYAALFLNNNGEGHPIDPASVVSPVSIDSNTFVWGAGRATSVNNRGGTYYVGVVNALVRFDFNATMGRPIQIGNVLQIPGGLPLIYDGAQQVEADFAYYPEVSSTTTGAAGSLSTGTYGYIIVYAWTDAKGNTYRSAGSDLMQVSNSANDRNNLTIKTLRMGYRTSVGIEIYRTLANGTTYYLVGGVQNDTTVDTVTFADTYSDANIQGNKLWYGSGGVLENLPRPPCKAYCLFKNRLWAFGCETQEQTWWSKEVVAGEGVAFNDTTLVMTVAGSGALVQGGVIDDKLVIFRANEAYVTAGEGPNDLGQGSFTTPQLIQAPIGAFLPDCVLQIPDGLLFVTPNSKGIYLLDRALNSTYKGAEVESFNTLSYVGAVVYNVNNQARFYSSNGTCVVYDWYFDRWYTWTNMAAVACALLNGTPSFLASDGTVKQDSGVSDNGTVILPVIQLHPVSPAGVRGWDRLPELQVVGESAASHTLKVTVTAEIDGQSIAEIFTFNVTGTAYERVACKIAQQQATAHTIRLEEVQYLGVVGSGMKLQGVTLKVGLQSGLHRLSPTYRATPS